MRFDPSEMVAIPPCADHLLPEESPLLLAPLFVGYYRTVSAALLSDSGFPVGAELCVVCLPSFLPEWALRLHRSGDRSVLSLAEADGQLWFCPDPAAVRVRRSDTAISVDLAAAIRRAWREALVQVKHPSQPRYGLDGESYHFALSELETGPMAGQTWSPDEQSRPGRLVALAHSLRQYILAGEAERSSIYQQLARQLAEVCK